MLSIAQPFLLNLTLRALGGSEVGVAASSLPLRFVALALPDVFFTIPARAISSVSGALGFQPTSAMFTTVMVAGDSRQMAYVYATISFLCQLVKAQTDLQHLYYARRASTRTQSQLIGSIYEKTLVRKDITGAIASDAKTKGKAGSKKEGDPTSDKAMASADVGKIVSLISTDASQCSNVPNILTVRRIASSVTLTLTLLWLLSSASTKSPYISWGPAIFYIVSWGGRRSSDMLPSSSPCPSTGSS